MAGTISNVTMTLKSFSHSWVSDMDILLVGPGGQKVLVMSDVGDTFTANNLNFTFSDAASLSLPSTGSFVSGTYKPTDYAPSDTFSAPAPSGPYGTTALSAFNSTRPNGTGHST